MVRQAPPDPLVAVLPRLESELGSLTGEPVALGGGITNHNVRMCLGGADVVVRFCAEGVDMLGIDRSVEDVATRRAAALGIGPEVGEERHDLGRDAERGCPARGHVLDGAVDAEHVDALGAEAHHDVRAAQAHPHIVVRPPAPERDRLPRERAEL